jgi:hypothetical protein
MQDEMGKTCGAAVETAGHRSLVGKLYERRRGDNVQDNVDGRIRINISHRGIGCLKCELDRSG